MAHSSWLGPARLCDHASKAPNTCAVHPRLSPEGTRRHRMGAYLGGPLPRPSRAITPGLAPDRPRPWPTRGAQELGGGEYATVAYWSWPQGTRGPGVIPRAPALEGQALPDRSRDEALITGCLTRDEVLITGPATKASPPVVSTSVGV